MKTKRRIVIYIFFLVVVFGTAFGLLLLDNEPSIILSMPLDTLAILIGIGMGLGFLINSIIDTIENKNS